jgi:RNA polymerase sigma factor (sigma-70 family)
MESACALFPLPPAFAVAENRFVPSFSADSSPSPEGEGRPQTVEALIASAQAGDAGAMDQLLELLRPYLEKLARDYADPDHASESTSDLVQESWLRAWQRLGQFSGGVAGEETLPMFRAWVGQIVHRLGLNRQRDRRAQRRQPAGRRIIPLAQEGYRSEAGDGAAFPEAGGPTPSAAASLDEEAHLVHQAIDSLADGIDRAIIRLRFFESLSLRQVAERLQLSYDQVRDRFRASMSILERRLGDLE